MNHFLLSYEDRINEWKSLRNKIKNFEVEEQLNEVNKWWNLAPLIKFNIDIESKIWPTPWEILLNNKYCDISKAYMMLKTLILSNEEFWIESRFKLLYVKDIVNEDIYMILLVDNKYILNHYSQKIVLFENVKKDFIIQSIFQLNDGTIEEYNDKNI